jgi:hypothetical protein
MQRRGVAAAAGGSADRAAPGSVGLRGGGGGPGTGGAGRGRVQVVLAADPSLGLAGVVPHGALRLAAAAVRARHIAGDAAGATDGRPVPGPAPAMGVRQGLGVCAGQPSLGGTHAAPAGQPGRGAGLHRRRADSCAATAAAAGGGGSDGAGRGGHARAGPRGRVRGDGGPRGGAAGVRSSHPRPPRRCVQPLLRAATAFVRAACFTCVCVGAHHLWFQPAHSLSLSGDATTTDIALPLQDLCLPSMQNGGRRGQSHSCR